MMPPHDENDVLCECLRCYPHDEDDEQCDCAQCLEDEVATAEEEQAAEEEDDDDDETHPDDCTCGPCCHAQMVGLGTVVGDGDPLTYLERFGVQGLVEIGEAVLAGGPVFALDEHLSEEEIQAMQSCAFGASLSAERRNILHRVNFQRPDLVTSSDLFAFQPVLTDRGRALLVTLGRLPAKPGDEVSHEA
jgi:hypothetical protein